ncbi:mechanosensitive ion channel family protein [Legionella nagasakiensis]|uniref:mechanosensitive ion channel family protein n=1 Tax=Legionella nagasakiensis TaxID=535290 RepID=UPI00105462A3|nr:mechanosensitive ion channel domain-containing protein [Legionella nagasakiensis]
MKRVGRAEPLFHIRTLINNLVKNLLITLVLCWSGLMFSASNAVDFDSDRIKNKLSQIHQNLSSNALNIDALYSLLSTIKDLQQQTEKCVADNKEHLKRINQLLDDETVAPTLAKEDKSQYNYLIKQKNLYSKQVASCSLSLYRLHDLRINILSQIKKKEQYILLEKGMPPWKIFQYGDYEKFFFNAQALSDFMGFISPQSNQLTIIYFLIILIVFYSSLSYKWSFNPEYVKHDVRGLTIIKRYAIILLPVGVLSLYIHLIAFYKTGVAARPFFTDVLFLYLLVNAMNELYIRVILVNRPWFDHHLVDSILLRTKILLGLILFGILGLLFFNNQPIPQLYIDFIKTVYLTILSIAALWTFWTAFELDSIRHKLSRRSLHIMMNTIIALFLVPILMAWIGYQQFATFFIPSVLGTILILFIYWRLCIWINYAHDKLQDKLSSMIIKHHRGSLVELQVIRIAILIGITINTCMLLMVIWWVPKQEILSFFNYLHHGFQLNDMRIAPLRILRAVGFFCLILVIGRIIARRIGTLKTIAEDPDRQATIVMLVTYFTYLIALLIALIISGINLRFLGLILGGFSVGIGFSLRSIMTSFISGLVLFIKKPIKVGDHVIIEQVEGLVKKISLLSTQITTETNSEVIFPNSLLIEKSIVCYTFDNNRYVKINIPILIGNSDDLNKAKHIIQNIVSQHKQVVQTPPYEPEILYELAHDRGANQFYLDVRCVISDIEKKPVITSELNMEIIEALQANNIDLLAKN